MATRKPGKNSIDVDFTGVESGGRAVPDDQYLLKVVEAEHKQNQAKDGYLINWKYKVVNGPYAGATIYDNTSLKPQALWRLRSLMDCFGMNPPDGKFKLDLDEVIGKTVVVDIVNETYQGKERPKIANFLMGGAESTTPGGGSKAPAESTGPKVGAMIKFNAEDETYEGKVLGISGDSVRVQVGDD